MLGLAYALEPTSLVAVNPFVRSSFEGVESADERAARLAVMGKPTLRGREDWLAHFMVSAGLAESIGELATLNIGIQKETADAIAMDNGHGSGFSFADLQADVAGIAFGRWLTDSASGSTPADVAPAFQGARFMPDPTALAEGLTGTDFQSAWGGLKDPRFIAEVARLRQRAEHALRTVTHDIALGRKLPEAAELVPPTPTPAPAPTPAAPPPPADETGER